MYLKVHKLAFKDRIIRTQYYTLEQLAELFIA